MCVVLYVTAILDNILSCYSLEKSHSVCFFSFNIIFNNTCRQGINSGIKPTLHLVTDWLTVKLRFWDKIWWGSKSQPMQLISNRCNWFIILKFSYYLNFPKCWYNHHPDRSEVEIKTEIIPDYSQATCGLWRVECTSVHCLSGDDTIIVFFYILHSWSLWD